MGGSFPVVRFSGVGMPIWGFSCRRALLLLTVDLFDIPAEGWCVGDKSTVRLDVGLLAECTAQNRGTINLIFFNRTNDLT